MAKKEVGKFTPDTAMVFEGKVGVDSNAGKIYLLSPNGNVTDLSEIIGKLISKYTVVSIQYQS